MSTRRLINNDYSFGNGRFDIIEGLDECLQKCQTSLSQLKGEWFLDGRDGVAWGSVLGQRTDIKGLTSIIKDKLLTVDGVHSVDDIVVDVVDRKAYVFANLTTDFGYTNFNQSLNVLEVLANDATN